MPTSRPLSPTDNVTLDNCDRELIHLPGAIQSHGCLIAGRGPRLEVSQYSANVERLTGWDETTLLGASIFSLLPVEAAEQLRGQLAAPSLRETNPLRIALESGRYFNAVVHRSNGVVVLELEPAVATRHHPLDGFDPRLRGSALRLQAATDPTALMIAAAEEVRKITGFDRVMVYRFDRDWNGEVVAESKQDFLEPFLGQRYPASDIPEQARRLYTLNWLRFVADVNDERVPLVPAVDPATGAPLDMTFSVLRSVSPIHIEYLRNMGVQASMSISLVFNGQLRGLIACHHYAGPHVVPVTVRDTAEYLGYTLSWQLSVLEEAKQQRLAGEAKAWESELVRAISASTELIDGMDSRALLRMVDAAGAAVVLAEGTRRLGAAPSNEVVREIVSHLRLRPSEEAEDVFVTDHFARVYAPAEGWSDVAAGVLAVPISADLGEYILWFRPAVEQIVKWAGEPVKHVVGEGKAARLTPRGSFELWQEVVRGRALPWEPWQTEAATRLRGLLLGGIRTRAVALRNMNARLLSADRAKDNFIATVSHELRTPLNAIAGWSSILLNDARVADGRKGLEVIARNVHVQLQLIEDLLDISRITSGKLSLQVEHLDVGRIVESAVEACALAIRAKELSLDLELGNAVAPIRGDSDRLRQVVTNLVTNAVKFTPKGGRISVKVQHEKSDVVVRVEDTGQGIDPAFLPHVFDAFRQQDEAMSRRHGGLGLGLAIVKRLVELHGGRIEAASHGVGAGAAFTVRLPITPFTPPQSERSPSSSREEPAPDAADKLRGLRLLVVEDDNDSRDLIVNILEGEGARVTAAPDATTALQLLGSATFDALVSDVGMPEIDGLELMRRIRALPDEARATVPAVALTAYTRALDRTSAAKAGYQAHIPKPVDPEELVAVVAGLLKGRRGPSSS